MGDSKQDVDSILNSTPDYIKKIQSDISLGTKPFKCAVISCPNLYHKQYHDHDDLPYKFHKFPKSSTIRTTWTTLCRLPELTSTDDIMVCSDHFLLDDYERNYKEEFKNPKYRRPLKPTALPSKRLEGEPVHCIEVVDAQKSEAMELVEDTDDDPSELVSELNALKAEERRLHSELKELQRKVRLRKQSIYALNKQLGQFDSATGEKQQKGTLAKVFSDAQINVLRGKRKVVWSDDDLAMAFSLRQMSSRECYLYLKYTLNLPLPALSCVQRWAASKK